MYEPIWLESVVDPARPPFSASNRPRISSSYVSPGSPCHPSTAPAARSGSWCALADHVGRALRRRFRVYAVPPVTGRPQGQR